MAALLEALPAFTSLEQFESHQSATPDTFQIAPVLRRKVENCSMVLRPNKIEGLSYAETGISGDLYLSEGCVSLFPPRSSRKTSSLIPRADTDLWSSGAGR